jgi:hypothetical protein
VEYYNESIAKNKSVEMVWITRDRDEGAMEKWLKAEKMPWPTVKFRSVDKVDKLMTHYKNSVPGYFLVDANNELVASGLSAAKAKIAELQ